MLQINEIFGPTIQGEGMAAGRHCMFVRLALCNLECSWCDTAYTWAFTPEKASKTASGQQYDRESNLFEMKAWQVLDQLVAKWDIYHMPTMIVISGGEPMMQQEALMPLLYELTAAGNEVHIETAGTIAPKDTVEFTALDGGLLKKNFDDVVTQYNVSPKLAHSANLIGKRYKPIALREFARNPKARFKFVLRSASDLNEVDEMIMHQGILPRSVQVMPEGNSVDDNLERARSFAAAAIARGYGVSLRAHVLLWPGVNREI